MSRAQNEMEVLRQMEHHLHTYGKIGATSQGWTDRKLEALLAVSTHAAENGAALRDVIDVGVGDMSHIDRWPPFKQGRIHYEAVDGSEEILELAQNRFGYGTERFPRCWTLQTLTEMLDDPAIEDADLTICIDVVYHIPHDDLYEDVVRWLAKSTRRYLVVSYATSMVQPGDPKRVGDPGFAWFPRPWQDPEGFQRIWAMNNHGCGQPQQQELAVLVRSSG